MRDLILCDKANGLAAALAQPDVYGEMVLNMMGCSESFLVERIVSDVSEYARGEYERGFVVPGDSVQFNEPHSVGRRIARTLTAMAETEAATKSNGALHRMFRALREGLVSRLLVYHWRVSVTMNDRYQVLPPQGRVTKETM